MFPQRIVSNSIPPLATAELNPATVSQLPELVQRYGTVIGNALSEHPYLVAGLDQLRHEDVLAGR